MSHSICYIDEAGCTDRMVSATCSTQPVFIVTGLFVNESAIRLMTDEFTALKKQFFPSLFKNINHQLDAMPIELKGVEIKKALRGDFGRKAKKANRRFVDEVLKLLTNIGAQYVSNVWVKKIGANQFKGHAVYSVSTQRIARLFEDYLFSQKHRGIIVSDFRTPGNNRIISHSIFTQMYKKKQKGNAYPSLLEVPLFGVSNNHAGLQITDILTSALLSPMATVTYCSGFVTNVHVNPADLTILKRYQRRLKKMQYKALVGKPPQVEYGVKVSDRHANKSAAVMFASLAP